MGVRTKERKGVTDEVLIDVDVGPERRSPRYHDDDDDVYYYSCWRLKLEGETENMGASRKNKETKQRRPDA